MKQAVINFRNGKQKVMRNSSEEEWELLPHDSYVLVIRREYRPVGMTVTSKSIIPWGVIREIELFM